MNNDNTHYDYCRCCGVWVKKIEMWDGNQICRECHREYGYDWPRHKEGLNATVAPVSDEL